MKKGFALISVLAVVTLLTASIYTAVMSVSLEAQIARNKRLADRAKLNAQSGLSHFTSKNFHYEDVVRNVRHGNRSLILSEKLTERDKYEVLVMSLGEDRFEVLSKGTVLKEEKILASSSVIAVFQSVWLPIRR